MNVQDQAIVAAYSFLGTSVDRIAVFSELRAAFLARLPKELRADHDDDQILWRLVQLRKNRKLPTLPSEN
jgi:hypothetical protein